jgi:hypothetical protein
MISYPTFTPVPNPWTSLPKTGNLVLPNHLAVINTRRWINDPDYQYHFNLIPEPFIGNPEALVVALNLNPGYDPKDITFHRMPQIRKVMLDNLDHKYNYNYYLDPILNGSPGSDWWCKRLKTLIKDTSLSRVSDGLFIIENIPYHSIKYKSITLSSQSYNDYLIAKAISRDALIIIMRGKSEWFNRNTSLINYQHTGNVLIMKNPRCAYFTPKNLPGYEKVIKAL